jgi:hypothetical protein
MLSSCLKQIPVFFALLYKTASSENPGGLTNARGWCRAGLHHLQVSLLENVMFGIHFMCLVRGPLRSHRNDELQCITCNKYAGSRWQNVSTELQPLEAVEISNSDVGRNYWETRIETTGGPRYIAVFDQTSSFGQLPMTRRSFNFSLPAGSTHFELTFQGGGVCL